MHGDAVALLQRRKNMAIVGLMPGTEIPYIPLSERENEKDPCTIHIKYVSNSKVRDYSTQLTKSMKNVKDPDRINEISMDMERQQFVENVTKVENYPVGDRMVTTGAELYEVADRALIVEIIRTMESVRLLTAGQRKNSSGGSATA
jgi:hypothetical protein